jgi:hypothetical protein
MDRRQNHIPLFELEELEIRRAQLWQTLKRAGLTVLGLAGAGALLWSTASPHHASVDGKLPQAVSAVSNLLTEQAKSLAPPSVAHQVRALFAPAPPPHDLSSAHRSDTDIPVPSASEAEALPPTPPAPPAPQPQHSSSASADRRLPQVRASAGASRRERLASGNFPETVEPPHARPNASVPAKVKSKQGSKPRVSAPVKRARVVEGVEEPDEPVESPCARGALESCGYARSPISSNVITKVYTVDPRTREEKLTGIYTSPPNEVGR